MTDRERAIVMAYTGCTMLKGKRLDAFYDYIAEVAGRPVYTHELPEITREHMHKIKGDFQKLCAGDKTPKTFTPELSRDECFAITSALAEKWQRDKTEFLTKIIAKLNELDWMEEGK